MIYPAKSTEFGEFCIIFFQNLKFGQILSRNSNFGRPKSTKIPEFRPFRSGPVKNQNRNPNPCSPLAVASSQATPECRTGRSFLVGNENNHDVAMPMRTRSKSIFTHTSDEVPGTRFFHPDGVNRPSRAPGSLFSPGSGPSSIRRAHAIPGLPGRARGLRTKETRAKRRGKFPRVVWPRPVGESGRSSSSSSRLPCIVVFPARIVFRAL
jgi:hypothetical protein